MIDALHIFLMGYAVALTAGIYSLAKGYEALSVVATHMARISTDVECAAGMLERAGYAIRSGVEPVVAPLGTLFFIDTTDEVAE